MRNRSLSNRLGKAIVAAGNADTFFVHLIGNEIRHAAGGVGDKFQFVRLLQHRFVKFRHAPAADTGIFIRQHIIR